MLGVFPLNSPLFKDGMNVLAHRFLFLSSLPYLPSHPQRLFPVLWEAQILKAYWFAAAATEKAYMKFKFAYLLEGEE